MKGATLYTVLGLLLLVAVLVFAVGSCRSGNHPQSLDDTVPTTGARALVAVPAA